MSPPEKFEAAWAEEESSAAKIQDLLRDGRELVALLRRCRPFVWRAMQGGKSPHAQDKVDAEALWPLIEGMDK